MSKNAAKIALLIAVLTLFLTSLAYADTTSTLRLRIEDVNTGAGIVVSSNGTNGIITTTQFESFTVQMNLVFTDQGNGYGQLALSGTVNRSASATPARLRITVEDSDYNSPNNATANFMGMLAGGADPTVPINGTTAPGSLSQGTTANFQTWINTANVRPNFGADGVYNNVQGDPLNCNTTPQPGCVPGQSLNANDVVVPADANTYAAFGGSGESFGSNTAPAAFVDLGTGGDVPVGPYPPGYSLIQQATINFGTAGQATFEMQTSVNTNTTGKVLQPVGAPEPASLLLLGSGLVGLGVLRRKHGRLS